MEKTIINWVKDVISMFQNLTPEVIDILCLDIHYGSDGQPLSLWTYFVIPIQEIVKPVAYSICVFFFLMQFFKLKEKTEKISLEQYFWLIAKGVLSKVIVDVVPKLMELIYLTVCEWITKVNILNRNNNTANGTSALESVNNKLVAILENAGFFEMIGYAITLIVPILVCWAVSLVAKAISYGRMVELMMLFAVMPIPCAFVLEQEYGAGNITRNFIFNFSAVCLQGLFIVIACSLYPFLLDMILNGATPSGESASGLAYTLCMSAIVLLITVTKSGSWAKQLLHVN